jgi:hypothetical protein
LEAQLGNSPLLEEKNLRKTIEYFQAVYLLQLKDATSAKLKTIDKELRGVNYLSREAVALAKVDIQRDLLEFNRREVCPNDIKNSIDPTFRLATSLAKNRHDVF